MRPAVSLVLSVFLSIALPAAPPKACVAGSVPVGTFQLQIRGPSGEPLPAATINVLKQGYRVLYKPVQLPADVRKEARVALVLAPAEGEITGTSPLTILDLQPAAGPAEWTIPHRVSVLMLVFGPAGLDEKKITNIVTREEELVSQVAGYADQTALLESTIRTLTVWDEDPESGDEVESRLGDTPVERALLALLRAQNPSLSTFNPLAAGRRAPPATLMGKAADGFFDNAGAVVPGGGILPGVKGFLMPDTELRSVYAQHGDGAVLTLCGKRRPPRSRLRVAYLWAHRVVDTAAPAIALAAEAHVPAGARSPLAVKLRASDWDIVEPLREWTLTPASGGTPSPASVVFSAAARTADLDLRRLKTPPGVYKLSAKWDWDVVPVTGQIRVEPLGDISAAKLTAAAQDSLIAGAGIVPLTLSGPDFQFVDKVVLSGARLKSVMLDFRLPNGKRAGRQESLTVEVDTSSLRPDTYTLTITQAGSPAEIPLRVLPPLPVLTGLPVRVNLDSGEQSVDLTGTGLDRVRAIECERADVRLLDGGKRAAIRLRTGARAGDRLPLLLRVEGVAAPVRVEGALAVGPARPKVTATLAGIAEDLGISLRPGELPAGSFAQFSLRMEARGDASGLEVLCLGRPLRFLLGERTPAGRLEQLGATWFLAFDPGAAGPSGCNLVATVFGEASRSESLPLGRVILLPRLESLIAGVLRGEDLEVIEKTGWDSSSAEPVAGFPIPLAGAGPKQILRLTLPSPPQPEATFKLWLRGESEPRDTTLKLIEPPKP